MLADDMTNYCISQVLPGKNYFRIRELPAEYRFLGAGAEFVGELDLVLVYTNEV